MTLKEFKKRWESDKMGGGITNEDVAYNNVIICSKWKNNIRKKGGLMFSEIIKEVEKAIDILRNRRIKEIQKRIKEL